MRLCATFFLLSGATFTSRNKKAGPQPRPRLYGLNYFPNTFS